MTEPGGFLLDTSRWPLVVVEAPKRPVTDEEIDAFVAAQHAMLARGQRYVEIADTRDVHMMPPSQRKKFADFLRETDPVATQMCAGLAIVVRSPLMRGGMTAIFWIFQPSYPIKPVASIAEAGEFLIGAAQTANLDLSAAARDFLLGGEAAAQHT